MAATPQSVKQSYGNDTRSANYAVVQENLAAPNSGEWYKFFDGCDVNISGGATLAAYVERAFLDDKSDAQKISTTDLVHGGPRTGHYPTYGPAWFRVVVTTLTTSDAVITKAGRVD